MLTITAHFMPNDYLIELVLAYYSTAYRLSDHGIEIRIGAPNTEFDEFCRKRNICEWAFLTAFNPASVQTSAQADELSNAKLKAELDKGGFRYCRGLGVPDDCMGWEPEVSFFVWNIDLSTSSELARQFGQKAIVYGNRAILPSIIWINHR